MKKVLFMAAAIALAGTLWAQAPDAKAATNSNRQAYCNFVDKNKDGICDNFKDANKDGKCDNCVFSNGNCPNGQNRTFKQGRGLGAAVGKGTRRMGCGNCPYNVTVQNKQ